MRKGKRAWLIRAAAILALAGGFFTGIGAAGFLAQVHGKGQAAEPVYEGGLTAAGNEGAKIDAYERDRRNALLAENMRYVSMEQKIVFEGGDSAGYAGIENKPESALGCKVKLIRDATGETLYQSEVIDPGYYIETIQLTTVLKKGYYPCTVVWSFYEGQADGFVGSTAGKIVVIVEQ